MASQMNHALDKSCSNSIGYLFADYAHIGFGPANWLVCYNRLTTCLPIKYLSTFGEPIGWLSLFSWLGYPPEPTEVG
jgi:hypothetical protein